MDWLIQINSGAKILTSCFIHWLHGRLQGPHKHARTASQHHELNRSHLGKSCMLKETWHCWRRDGILERVACLRKRGTVDEEMVGHRAAPTVLVTSPFEIDRRWPGQNANYIDVKRWEHTIFRHQEDLRSVIPRPKTSRRRKWHWRELDTSSCELFAQRSRSSVMIITSWHLHVQLFTVSKSTGDDSIHCIGIQRMPTRNSCKSQDTTNCRSKTSVHKAFKEITAWLL